MSETKITKKRKETGKSASLRTDKNNITISIVNNTQKARRSGGAANGKKSADTRFRDTRDPRPLIQQFFNGVGGVPETRTVESPPEMRRFTENQGIRTNLREATRAGEASPAFGELPSSSQFITGIDEVGASQIDTGTQTRGEPSRISFTNLPPLRQSMDTQTDEEPFIPQAFKDSVSYNAALLNEANDRRERERMETEAAYANLLGSSRPMISETETRPFMFGIGDESFRATAPGNIKPVERKGVDFFQDDEQPPLMVQPSASVNEPEIVEDETQSYAAAEPIEEVQEAEETPPKKARAKATLTYETGDNRAVDETVQLLNNTSLTLDERLKKAELRLKKHSKYMNRNNRSKGDIDKFIDKAEGELKSWMQENLTELLTLRDKQRKNIQPLITKYFPNVKEPTSGDI